MTAELERERATVASLREELSGLRASLGSTRELSGDVERERATAQALRADLAARTQELAALRERCARAGAHTAASARPGGN